MSIIMTGGGTGGHLAIVKAVKEQLVKEQGAGSREQMMNLFTLGQLKDRTDSGLKRMKILMPNTFLKHAVWSTRKVWES